MKELERFYIQRKDVICDYGKLLGEGTFGRVFLGTFKDLRVACKEYKDRSRQNKSLYEEIQVFRDVSHAFVPRFYGYTTSPLGKHMIIMEYCIGVSLYDHLLFHRMPIPDRVTLCHQMMDLFEYLHGKRIIFRDVKPDNIVYDLQQKTMKVVDFGMAVQLPHNQNLFLSKHTQGTPGFIAPESKSYQGYSFKSDVYSLGVTLACILHNYHIPKKFHWNENIPLPLKLMVQKCLYHNPERRPTIKEMLIATAEETTADQTLGFWKSFTTMFWQFFDVFCF